MITKDQLIENIKDLPESFSVEEIIDRVILLDKIDRGIEQADNNEGITEQELDKIISDWFE